MLAPRLLPLLQSESPLAGYIRRQQMSEEHTRLCLRFLDNRLERGSLDPSLLDLRPWIDALKDALLEAQQQQAPREQPGAAPAAAQAAVPLPLPVAAAAPGPAACRMQLSHGCL